MHFLSKSATLLLLATALAVSGCSSKSTTKVSTAKFNSKGESLAGFAGTGSAYLKGNGPIPRGGGKYHVGKPYQVAGRWFHPKEQPGYDRQGTASWYGEAFHRRKTSNGEYFDMNMLSAAHPTLPLPSYAKVTNLANGKSVIVRINDRGPFVGTRIIDLSKRTADVLDFRSKGKADVRVQWIGKAPINDSGSHLAAMNKSLRAGASVKQLVSLAGGKSVRVANAPAARAKPRAVQQLAAASTGTYMILVGTFGRADNAEAALDQVSQLGPARILELTSNGTTGYRLQLGPFRSKLGAEDALSALQAEGFPGAVIVGNKLDLAEADALL